VIRDFAYVGAFSRAWFMVLFGLVVIGLPLFFGNFSRLPFLIPGSFSPITYGKQPRTGFAIYWPRGICASVPLHEFEKNMPKH